MIIIIKLSTDYRKEKMLRQSGMNDKEKTGLIPKYPQKGTVFSNYRLITCQ